MSINVYWTSLERAWMRADPPEKVSKSFYQKNSNSLDIERCPAFNNYIKNMFSLKSLYSFEFEISNNDVLSKDFTLDFFQEHVNVRSIEKKMFSFNHFFIFFTDEKSLNMTANLPPFFEENNITERCIHTPGIFDIGRWFRPIEFGFLLKDGFNSFRINEGEIYSYIKFDTDSKINFVQFEPTEKIYKYMQDVNNSFKYSKKRMHTMDTHYKNFIIKKQILKEIRNNLVDVK